MSRPVGSAATVRASRAARRPEWRDAVFAPLVRRRLAGLREGAVILDDAARGGPERLGAEGIEGTVRVENPRFYSRSALAGALGFAESYLRGEWTTDDLVAVLRVFARDVARHSGKDWAQLRFARPLARHIHRLRRNTRSGSRRNIRDHYDLGNDFYELFLDDTMTYSCGIFAAPDTPLRDASVAKLDRVCRELDLRPEHRVLEIGTGWGSFAMHAARHHGCHVTTTTISEEQRRYAEARIREAGLEGRITLLGRDYRDLGGAFDRLVSLEMIEAVGNDHLAEFFRTCAARLKPDGAMMLQAITMPDRDFASYLTTVDFIQRYVFPGSCLTSLGAITDVTARHTDFRVADVYSMGPDYARTLRHWRERFFARLPEVRAQGFDERFIRLWHYYLAYCEAGFLENYVDDLQVVLGKPAWRASRHADGERISAEAGSARAAAAVAP